MARLLTENLATAFVAALRTAIENEPNPSLRLRRMGEIRRQMITVLQLAPYGDDPVGEAKVRAELASTMETAYFTILSGEALGLIPLPGVLAVESVAFH